MNSGRVERFLAQAADNQQASFPDAGDRKVCYAPAEFELDGRTYLPNDRIELDATQARKLQAKGTVVVTGDGRCDRIRVGKYQTVGFKPWDEPQWRPQDDEFGETLIYVRLLQPQKQVIIGMGSTKLPERFFFPWKWVRALSFRFESEDSDWVNRDATFEILKEQSPAA